MSDEVSTERPAKVPFPSPDVVVGLLLIMLLAAMLRAQHVGEPLWLDELHTAWVVEDGVSDVAGRAAAGNQGPVFYYAQWLVGQMSESSVFRYRCLSLVAGLLLVPVVFLVVREACGDAWAGWLAALMVSVDRFSVIFSCEARPYAWVQLVTVIHLYLGWQYLLRGAAGARRRPNWVRVGWITSGALLFHLHYTAALILVAEVVALLVLQTVAFRAGSSRYTIRKLDPLVLVLLCSPALPQLLSISQRRGAWAEFVPVPGILGLLTLLPLLVYVAFPFSARLLTTWRGRNPARNVGDAAWWMLLASGLMVPVLIAWTSTVSGVAALYWPRYLIGSSTIAILIAAALVSSLPGLRRRWVITLLLLATVLSTESAISFSGVLPEKMAWPGFLHRSGVVPRQEDWQALVFHINEHDPRGRWPVFLAADLIEDRQLGSSQSTSRGRRMDLEEYCLFPLQGCYRLRDSVQPILPLASTPPLLPAEYLPVISETHGGWFVVRGNSERVMAWQQVLKNASLQKRHEQTVQLQWFGDLALFRLEPLHH
jgi:hypothetical protein